MNHLTYLANLPQQSRDELIDIMESNHPISLRLIDFFVTTYSKKHNVQYGIGHNQVINVNTNYKTQLKKYGKSNFDPFRRSNKLTHQFADGKILNTSIGQLNFFKWMIDNQMIPYINYNFNNIINEM